MLPEATTVHHLEDGPRDAPPLVLSHPLGTDLHVWRPNVARLAEHHRVIRYDQRGHGASPVLPGPYSIADLAADVLALLDRLGIARADFAGTSLGGMVGLWLAVHAPERIDHLVVCSGSAWLGDPEVWHDRASIVRSNGTVTIADGTVHRWVSPRYARTHPDVVDRLVARFVGTADEGYAATCEALAGFDLRDDLARITSPTLIVAGGHDAALPIAHAERLADGIADVRLEVIEDAGHFVSLEDADRVTTLLEQHLEGHAVGSA